MMPLPPVMGHEGAIEAVYGALLHRAHGDGLCAMQVTLLQAPAPENGHTALVRAEIHTAQGRFSALGEARGEDGCSPAGLCGTAELRAKVRALQDALDAPSAALQPPLPLPLGAVRGALWTLLRDDPCEAGSGPGRDVAVSLDRPRFDLLRGGLR